jgi:hypothetical protein
MLKSNHALVGLACAAHLTLVAGCGSNDDARPAGTISVQISGEEAATDGFLFPSGSEVTFADGWELHFSHVLVTVDGITISKNPNRSPSDQSQTDGAVARATGPWAIDLAVEGTAVAAGGEGTAVPVTIISNQNLVGGAPFQADEQYAFGYDVVAATDAARRVNFDGDVGASEAYSRMIAAGDAVMYTGTATFKGGTDCAGSDAKYDFGGIPAELNFELGFATPTTYINCQNQENEGQPFEGEEYPRGVAVLPNRAALAQMTFHVEHPWFSSTVHDSDIYFDQMAAQLVGKPDGTTLTMKDFIGLDPTAFTDGTGEALPWRTCTPDVPLKNGQRTFDAGSLPIDPAGDPTESLRDYRDYVDYVQSTQGHLNGGEGLCYVQRNYASPR